MAFFYTKELLYDVIHAHKIKSGYALNEYGFDMINFCKNEGICIEQLQFKTKALRGMASIGKNHRKDVILLNADRNKIEQNYDCGHEFIHLRIHRDLSQGSFHCIDAYYANQDPFLEWQANEGAAEFLVPYTVFIPFVKNHYEHMNTSSDIISFKEYAAGMFNVSSKVVEYRLESLKYEINQHLNGTCISNIEILSQSQQKKRGINIRSINDLENDLFDKEVGWSESHFINFNAVNM